jgi:hypothetical protein
VKWILNISISLSLEQQTSISHHQLLLVLGCGLQDSVAQTLHIRIRHECIS